jgi:hypothetical protein
MGILRTDTISGLETPTPVTGSVSFDGSGDYLSVGSVGNWNFLHNGLTDWTVEFWARSGTATAQFSWGTAGSSSHTGFHFQIMSLSDGQGNGQGLYAQASRGSAGNYRYWGANNCLSLNTWHHIAAVFKSSSKTLALYVDGREVDNDTGTANGTFATTDYSSSDSTYALRIGENPGGTEDYNGYISNLRILTGTALYTSNFTPPTRELQPIGDTVLLCCNNPDSAGAEATGKTITVNGDAVASTFSPGLTRDFTYGTQFDGVSRFDTQGYFVPPSGTTEQRGRGRGLFGSGYDGGAFRNTIDYVNIQSLGIAQDFGDLTVARDSNDQGFSSLIRGFFAGGTTPTNINVIDYVTIASTSNAIDFGDLLSSTYGCAGVSNSTRGLMMGGNTPTVINVIQYITMSSIGNTQDFGDLTGNFFGSAGFQSPTRGVCAGGGTPAEDNTIQYVTIATLGNAQDFGDATFSKSQLAGASNSTRGIFAGGTNENTINYVTIATTGNASDFGDLITGRREIGASSTPTRWVVGGGYNDASGVRLNSIEYVTIATTGNAQDFGDLSVGRSGTASCSDSHGGIS